MESKSGFSLEMASPFEHLLNEYFRHDHYNNYNGYNHYKDY